MNAINIDTATGNLFDAIGNLLVQAGKEDASGARRAIANKLELGDFETAANWLGSSKSIAEDLAAKYSKQLGC